MPKRRGKYRTKLNQSIGKPNILGHWGRQDDFFNKVTKGFKRIFGRNY